LIDFYHTVGPVFANLACALVILVALYVVIRLAVRAGIRDARK
jgi:hypothetical protein